DVERAQRGSARRGIGGRVGRDAAPVVDRAVDADGRWWVERQETVVLLGIETVQPERIAIARALASLYEPVHLVPLIEEREQQRSGGSRLGDVLEEPHVLLALLHLGRAAVMDALRLLVRDAAAGGNAVLADQKRNPLRVRLEIREVARVGTRTVAVVE